jgi:hypothetical protein
MANPLRSATAVVAVVAAASLGACEDDPTPPASSSSSSSSGGAAPDGGGPGGADGAAPDGGGDGGGGNGFSPCGPKYGNDARFVVSRSGSNSALYQVFLDGEIDRKVGDFVSKGAPIGVDDIVVTTETILALSTGVIRTAPRPTDMTKGTPIELGDPVDVNVIPPALRAFRGTAGWFFGIDAALGRSIVAVNYATQTTKTAVNLPLPADCERAVDFTASPALPDARDFAVVFRCSTAPLNRVYEVVTDTGGAVQQFNPVGNIDADEAIVATTTGAAFSARFVFLPGGKKRLAEHCVTPTLRAPIGVVGASP